MGRKLIDGSCTNLISSYEPNPILMVVRRTKIVEDSKVERFVAMFYEISHDETLPIESPPSKVNSERAWIRKLHRVVDTIYKVTRENPSHGGRRWENEQ
jgi:hypothetical protein